MFESCSSNPRNNDDEANVEMHPKIQSPMYILNWLPLIQQI
jgi:hypothetical protein